MPPDSTAPKHAAIVLAAGASRRLGQSKQLLRENGETLLHRMARLALETAPSECLLVVGANAPAIAAAISDLPVRLIHCNEWENGIGASLSCGVRALAPDCAGVLIVLCDQPKLDIVHLLRLRDIWHKAPLCAVASAYANTIGVPAILPRRWYPELSQLSGDYGAQKLLRLHRVNVITVPNLGLAEDIDGPNDWPRKNF